MFYYFNAEKKFYENPVPTIKPWATATDAEIADMLTAHYNGLIDLSTEEGWEVGSKRSIALSAMSATGVSESHHADSYDFVIIGHKHDDLTTPINGVTKAAITVQLDRILYKNTTDSTYTSENPSAEDEGGYMNSTNTNVGGWTSCARRTWCNSVFYNAVESGIKSLIKPVVKLTSAGNQSSVINSDNDSVFLLSEIEIFGTASYSKAGEGSQYSFFTTASNRYKKPSYTTYTSASWWERSPYGNNASNFSRVDYDGTAATARADRFRGLAPAFCL